MNSIFIFIFLIFLFFCTTCLFLSCFVFCTQTQCCFTPTDCCIIHCFCFAPGPRGTQCCASMQVSVLHCIQMNDNKASLISFHQLCNNNMIPHRLPTCKHSLVLAESNSIHGSSVTCLLQNIKGMFQYKTVLLLVWGQVVQSHILAAGLDFLISNLLAVCSG